MQKHVYLQVPFDEKGKFENFVEQVCLLLVICLSSSFTNKKDKKELIIKCNPMFKKSQISWVNMWETKD